MLPSPKPVEYSVLACGIDWLTCTARNGSASLALERVAKMVVDEQTSTGGPPTAQMWQGFKGYRIEGMFYGSREHDFLLCLSGGPSAIYGLQAIAASTNVSRIDFAVTLASNGEQLTLAHDAYNHYLSRPKGIGRPRAFDLRLNSTGGSTFYLNQRVSDNYGRIYDKGVEAKIAPPGLLWRYEVEFKRKVAKLQSTKLPPHEQLSAYVSDLVRSWWSERDVETPWHLLDAEACFNIVSSGASTDVLTWYRKSLAVSVARSVKSFGLSAVLESLGLQTLVQPIGRSRDGGN